MNEQLFDLAGTDKVLLKKLEKIINHAKRSIKKEAEKA
jgi:hypothetical protein